MVVAEAYRTVSPVVRPTLKGGRRGVAQPQEAIPATVPIAFAQCEFVVPAHDTL